MSHVKALIQRLEAKIKEQSGSSSTTSSSSASSKAPPSALKSANATPAAKAAPRTVVFTSPEEFAKMQRETEAKERQNKVQAKQMASRYNLTYRTLELKAQKDEEKAAMTAAASGTTLPPSTRRASLAARRQSMVTKPGAAGAGAGATGSATVVAPPRRASMMAKIPASGSTTSSTTTNASTAPSAPKEDVSIPYDGYEVYNAVEADAFWMTELALALAYEDEGGINRAILLEFFEEHDPDRIGEVDQLLKDWEGREDELFAHISLTYMSKQEASGNGVVDDSAERAAFAVFEQTMQEAEEDDALLAKAIQESMKDSASKAETTVAATTTSTALVVKPRRTSVINRVVLNQQGGVQAAEIASIPLLDIDVEEKSEETAAASASSSGAAEGTTPANPYIISGLAQNGHAWQLNAHGEEQNKVLREQMLATGHTEEEVNAVTKE